MDDQDKIVEIVETKEVLDVSLVQDLVDGEDKLHILRYLDHLKQSFGWSTEEAITQLLKNPVHTIERFDTWKKGNQ